MPLNSKEAHPKINESEMTSDQILTINGLEYWNNGIRKILILRRKFFKANNKPFMRLDFQCFPSLDACPQQAGEWEGLILST